MSSFVVFDIDLLIEYEFFSSLDYYFAKSMARAFDENNAIVLGSCALVSKALREGHICLDIQTLSGTVFPITQKESIMLKYPEYNSWIQVLKASPIVSDTIQTPLVLDSENRLYFSKYHDFQTRLACNISQRVGQTSSSVDEKFIHKMLDTFFPVMDTPVECQKNAVKNAILNDFTLISGGPGTGKTYVTTIIQKILVAHAKTYSLKEPKIICVAPTGKAASKMENGSTIHSVLKPLRDHPGFYHNKNNPIFADVIIIDEASMIDLLLFTRLLEAIPVTAKVILLGDSHQLSSIQAGSVFNDIIQAKALSEHIFFLEYNFRSKGRTGIEKLSKAIHHNDPKQVEALLTSGQYPDLIFENTQNTSDPIANVLHNHIADGYHFFLEAGTTEEALNRLNAFKVLCAHNNGEYGTLQMNHVCEKILRSVNIFDIPLKPFEQIIMVTVNDYQKGVFNGDTGIVYEKQGQLHVVFKRVDGLLKHFRYSDLPASDPAFAITIHKSQGSEFETVLIVVPDRLSPVLTRQLLYTGVTRAQKKVIIVGDMTIIKKAIHLTVKRNSGLTASLEENMRQV